MGDNSKIEWTDASWNPVTGCTKVSQGCKHCYAETLANRMWAAQYAPNTDGSPRRFTDVRLHPDRLEQPLRWRRPRRIFVNSMSDLFHDDIPDSFIGEVWSVMISAPQHTFQVLTKRPERMRDIVSRLVSESERKGLRRADNVWLGVSVEDQANANLRIPLLLQTRAAVRFLSCEPLLERVDLSGFMWGYSGDDIAPRRALDWVIVGGESGPGARPMHPDWARQIRDVCLRGHVPFFFKQWGEFQPAYCVGISHHPADGSGDNLTRVGKKNAGRLLDGQHWDEYPKVSA